MVVWSPHLLEVFSVGATFLCFRNRGIAQFWREMSWKIFNKLLLLCLLSLPFCTKPFWSSHQSHLDEGHATPWTAAYQAPPSMGFSRQEYWSGLPLPSPHKERLNKKMGTLFSSSQFLTEFVEQNSYYYTKD